MTPISMLLGTATMHQATLRRSPLSLVVVVTASLLASCSKTDRGNVEAIPKPMPADSPPVKPAPPPPAKDPAMSDDITWKMTRSKDTLRVDYHYQNRGSKPVYVNDGLVVQLQGGGYLKSKNFSVEVTDVPDTALIRIARPRGDVPAATVPPGFFVAVAPGASFDGSRELKLPLRRWDAMGREVMLPDRLKKASLEIESFQGEPPSWQEVAAKDGTPIKYPDGYSPTFLKGAVQPIP